MKTKDLHKLFKNNGKNYYQQRAMKTAQQKLY